MFVPPLNVALTRESLSRLPGFRRPPSLPKWFAKGARDGLAAVAILRALRMNHDQ